MSTSNVSNSSNAPSLGAKMLRALVTEAASKEIDSTLDLSGIFWMEHVNLIVGDKSLAEHFYIQFLGFTRDNASKSFHINLGQQQIHLAETDDPPQRIAGSIGLTVPKLQTLRDRIPAALQTLKDTQFELLKNDLDDSYLEIRGPWGNFFCIYDVMGDSKLATPSPAVPRKMESCHALGGDYGSHRMAIRGQPGIRFLEVACPVGKSKAIGRFYKEVLQCKDVQEFEKEGSAVVTISIGPGVNLVFVEQRMLEKDWYDAMKGVHICIYVDDFQGLYERLSQRMLIWTNPRFVHLDTCDTWAEAKASRTLRFKDIVDCEETNEKFLIQLEHETRPLRHGQYMKAQSYEPR
jgi:catechol-2,3-dioxygenase